MISSSKDFRIDSIDLNARNNERDSFAFGLQKWQSRNRYLCNTAFTIRERSCSFPKSCKSFLIEAYFKQKRWFESSA